MSHSTNRVNILLLHYLLYSIYLFRWTWSCMLLSYLDLMSFKVEFLLFLIWKSFSSTLLDSVKINLYARYKHLYAFEWKLNFLKLNKHIKCTTSLYQVSTITASAAADCCMIIENVYIINYLRSELFFLNIDHSIKILHIRYSDLPTHRRVHYN